MPEEDRPGVGRSIARRVRALRPDRRSLLLALIAFVVLFPASWWGVPHAVDSATVRGWDVDGVGGIAVLSELNNLLIAHRPDWYVAYPLFQYLLLATVYAPYLGILLLTGQLTHPTGVYPFGFLHPTAAIETLSLLAHAVTLAMAIGTVMVAYFIGRMVQDRRAGTLGAVALMLTVPFDFYSRTSNLDIPMLFWTATALLLSMRAVRFGLTTRTAIGIGVTAALAVATKDQAYAVLLPVVLYVIYATLRNAPESNRPDASVRTTSPWRSTGVLIGTGIAAFLIGGGIVISPGRFLRHIDYVLHFKETFSNVRYTASLTVIRPATFAGYMTLLRDCVVGIVTSVGLATAVAGLAGLVLTTLNRAQRGLGTLLIVSLVGFFVLTLAPIRFFQFRYGIFPSFVMALCAGALWSRMLSARAAVRVAGQLWIVVAFVMAGWAELDLTWQMLDDTRYAASSWFASVAAPGDSVAYFGKQHQLLYVPPGVTTVDLEEDPGAEARLCTGDMKFVYVAPDYFTDPTRQHSTFLPDSTYTKLLDDRLGFHRALVVMPHGLGRPPLPYFPFVNPEIQIFTLDAHHTCARNLTAPSSHHV